MTTPTRGETAVFLAKLRDQASFLQDPAIIDAVAFIERMAAALDQRLDNAELNSTEIGTNGQSTLLKEAA